ncbi:hypothetical protein [Paracoccus xiamenensis]|uniref:hypothetical protein n=1 Tax=Paracoccus xiamenensis TaxID=2714901 RepID=UPI001409E0C2|nr:hypothetical protein [Paracoccus xiamenensis]NHF72023.1 hypothetical protein [Paracoccus xiamenensis]
MCGPQPKLEIRSINEFYERWPSLRKFPMELTQKDTLTPNQRIVLDWMMLVIDRVGPADLPETTVDLPRTGSKDRNG